MPHNCSVYLTRVFTTLGISNSVTICCLLASAPTGKISVPADRNNPCETGGTICSKTMTKRKKVDQVEEASIVHLTASAWC